MNNDYRNETMNSNSEESEINQANETTFSSDGLFGDQIAINGKFKSKRHKKKFYNPMPHQRNSMYGEMVNGARIVQR